VGTNPGALTSTTRANDARAPLQQGNPVTAEADPFASPGFRIGTTEVQLSLEQSIGFSSNVSQNAGGNEGAFSQTDATASFTSDWSRHQWQTTLGGGYRKPFDGEEVDEITFFGNSNLRLDLVDGHTLTLGGFYNAGTQEFTSTTLVSGAVDTPLTQTYGGSLELERSDRKFIYRARGVAAFNTFEDADLGNGTSQSQEDQNNTLYSFSLRAGYEISPTFTPFVEGVYSIRDFDLETDRNGNRRDSETYEGRVGFLVDVSEKIQGEISAGYLVETFDDANLDDLPGFTINGSLNWFPERDSQVSLTVGTSTNNSITANDSGNLIYDAQLDYERQLNDRWSADAFAAVQFETNDDQNITIETGIGLEYWVNRFMAVTADVEYQTFMSDAANADFDEISGRIGIRLRR